MRLFCVSRGGALEFRIFPYCSKVSRVDPIYEALTVAIVFACVLVGMWKFFFLDDHILFYTFSEQFCFKKKKVFP